MNDARGHNYLCKGPIYPLADNDRMIRGLARMKVNGSECKLSDVLLEAPLQLCLTNKMAKGGSALYSESRTERACQGMI